MLIGNISINPAISKGADSGASRLHCLHGSNCIYFIDTGSVDWQ